MGGNVTRYGTDLIQTKQFLDGKTYFSTYATAQEVLSGIYQPSGTDYIIHVLGDNQREAYMNHFLNDAFDYAATLRENNTEWAYWVQRANWFFYRELYRKWHPIYANDYTLFWTRNNDVENHTIEEGVEISKKQIDKKTVKLVISTDESINGIADVLIDYSISNEPRKLSWFTWQQMLQIKNTGKTYADNAGFYEMNYLRPQSSEYVPIHITNGYGELTLKSLPEANTVLTVNVVEADCIYTVTSDFIKWEEITVNEDANTIISIKNTAKNANDLKNVKAVKWNDLMYQVLRITEDDNYILLEVNGTMQMSKGNIIEIIN